MEEVNNFALTPTIISNLILNIKDMNTIILFSALLVLLLSAVVYACIKSYRLNHIRPYPGEDITDSMIRKMLRQKDCIIIEDESNSYWIAFQFDDRPFYIRMCGVHCEVLASLYLDKSRFDPVVVRRLCAIAMRGMACGPMWYDESKSCLYVTVHSMNKTYKHMKSSFYDMILCVDVLLFKFQQQCIEKMSEGVKSNDTKAIVSHE